MNEAPRWFWFWCVAVDAALVGALIYFLIREAR